ncbi:MAG: hypothetical protein JWR26_4717 [Pedosphaera sp.]|nr:hypothetical protein [Pedosphaera sp.]
MNSFSRFVTASALAFAFLIFAKAGRMLRWPSRRSVAMRTCYIQQVKPSMRFEDAFLFQTLHSGNGA